MQLVKIDASVSQETPEILRNHQELGKEQFFLGASRRSQPCQYLGFWPPENRFLSWLIVIFMINLGKWCIFIFSLVLTE